MERESIKDIKQEFKTIFRLGQKVHFADNFKDEVIDAWELESGWQSEQEGDKYLQDLRRIHHAFRVHPLHQLQSITDNDRHIFSSS